MKTKIKYRQAVDAGEWTREERSAIRWWDRVCLSLGIVILIAAAFSWNAGTLELGEPIPVGFLLWFLLCCAYPVLGLLGLVNLIFGTRDTAFMRFIIDDYQVYSVIVINIFTIGSIWAIGRLWGLKLIGVNWLRVCANMLLILVFWGILQISFFGIKSIWDRGDMHNIHKHTLEPEPEQVEIVNPEKLTP